MASGFVSDQKLQDLLCPPTQLSPRTLSGGSEDANILQLAQSVEGGWPAQAETPFNRPGVHDRLFENEVDEPVRSTAGLGLHRPPISLSEVAEPFRSGQRVIRLGVHAEQEQPEPGVQVPPLANPLESVVIRLATGLKER